MLALSTTGWWAIGFAIGGVVVLLVALLLLAIIALARQIARQAAEITAALDGARRNTEPLFDIAHVNHALQRITGGLERVRIGADAGESADEGKPGLLERMADKLAPDPEPK